MNGRKLFAAAAGVFTATMLMASPAAAAPQYLTNFKTQTLTSAPSDWMETSCHQSVVELYANPFEWEQAMSGLVHRLKTIQIARGLYTMTDCLDPKNGYYLHTTTLDPHAAGLETAVGSSTWTLSSTRDYTWGSRLY